MHLRALTNKFYITLEYSCARTKHLWFINYRNPLIIWFNTYVFDVFTCVFDVFTYVFDVFTYVFTILYCRSDRMPAAPAPLHSIAKGHIRKSY